MFLRVLPNSAMRFLERFHQNGPRVPNRRCGVNFLDGFYCYATGFLAAFVSAHTISDNGETALALEFLVTHWLPVQVTILIILALATYIGKTGQLDSRTNPHQYRRPFLLFMQMTSLSFDRTTTFHPAEAGCKNSSRFQVGTKLLAGWLGPGEERTPAPTRDTGHPN
jgi:hypothetical protein